MVVKKKKDDETVNNNATTNNEETQKDDSKEVVDKKNVSKTENIKEEPKVAQFWTPKTDLGKRVKNGEITSIYQILQRGEKILEAEIVDYLIPDIKTDLLLVGQAKGKFGGGKRRFLRQVQKKTSEGNKVRFACLAVVGNEKGILGIGYAVAKETVPAREKAIRKAKLNLISVPFGSGSWEDEDLGTHSLPVKTSSKVGSIVITLLPAPKGSGLTVEKEVGKILSIAGYKDVRGSIKGTTSSKLNVLFATFDALKKLSDFKIHSSLKKNFNFQIA
jgi:small subunit ribosomal protein S5